MDFGRAASFVHPALSNTGLIRPLSNWDSLLPSPEASANSIASNPSANQPAKALVKSQVPHCGACCIAVSQLPVCVLSFGTILQATIVYCCSTEFWQRMLCTFMCFHLDNIA